MVPCTVPSECKKCGGTGSKTAAGGGEEPCSTCRGNGKVLIEVPTMVTWSLKDPVRYVAEWPAHAPHAPLPFTSLLPLPPHQGLLYFIGARGRNAATFEGCESASWSGSRWAGLSSVRPSVRACVRPCVTLKKRSRSAPE
eukprot:gene9118-biopygen7339